MVQKADDIFWNISFVQRCQFLWWCFSGTLPPTPEISAGLFAGIYLKCQPCILDTHIYTHSFTVKWKKMNADLLFFIQFLEAKSQNYSNRGLWRIQKKEHLEGSPKNIVRFWECRRPQFSHDISSQNSVRGKKKNAANAEQKLKLFAEIGGIYLGWSLQKQISSRRGNKKRFVCQQVIIRKSSKKESWLEIPQNALFNVLIRNRIFEAHENHIFASRSLAFFRGPLTRVNCFKLCCDYFPTFKDLKREIKWHVFPLKIEPFSPLTISPSFARSLSYMKTNQRFSWERKIREKKRAKKIIKNIWIF